MPERAVVQENLGYAEAGLYLKKSIPTLKRHVRDGTVPHVKIGRRVLFPVAVLDQWLADQAMASLRPQTPPQDTPRRRTRRINQPTSGAA